LLAVAIAQRNGAFALQETKKKKKVDGILNLFGMVTTKSHTEPTFLCVCKEKLDGTITSKKKEEHV